MSKQVKSSKEPPAAPAATDEEKALRASERVRQLALAGESIRLSVWDHVNNVFAWVETMPAALFSEEAVSEKYGGGRWQANAIGSDNLFKGPPAVFTIAGAPKPIRPAADVPAPARSDLELVLAELRAQRAAAPTGAGKDPTEIAASLMTAMGGMFAIMVKMLPQPGQAAAPASPSDLLATVREFVNLSRDLREPPAPSNPEGGGDPLIAAIAGPLSRIAERIMDERAARSRLPDGTHALAGPDGAAADGEKVRPVWWSYLAPHIPQLVKLAAADRTPHIYAAAFLDQAAPAVVAFLREKIATPEAAGVFLADVFANAPEAGQYRDWFADLVDAMREILVETDDATAAPAPPQPAA
jgi:hypothetical protein